MHSQHPLGKLDSPLPHAFPSALSPIPHLIISIYPLGPWAHGWEGPVQLFAVMSSTNLSAPSPLTSHSYLKKSIGNCHPQWGLSFSRERVAVGTAHLLCAQNMLNPMQKMEQTLLPALEEPQGENLLSKSELLRVGIGFGPYFLILVCHQLSVFQTVYGITVCQLSFQSDAELLFSSLSFSHFTKVTCAYWRKIRREISSKEKEKKNL